MEKRWAEGCHNASQLWRELRQCGYGGQRSRVKEYVQTWRVKSTAGPASTSRKLPNLKLIAIRLLSPRHRVLTTNLSAIALWLTKEPTQRRPEEQGWVDAVIAANPHIAAAEELAQQFRQAFRDTNVETLNAWMTRSATSHIPELQNFAASIQRDYAAVSAAVVQPWSNGPVEGQVHRLKLLNRQMYGRSGFALLRRRVLPFGVQNGERSP